VCCPARPRSDHGAAAARDLLPPPKAPLISSPASIRPQYGGSTTSILINLPGESSSVVTCLDGYQMARQGRAGGAPIAALGSFFAGCVATLAIASPRHRWSPWHNNSPPPTISR